MSTRTSRVRTRRRGAVTTGWRVALVVGTLMSSTGVTTLAQSAPAPETRPAATTSPGLIASPLPIVSPEPVVRIPVESQFAGADLGPVAVEADGTVVMLAYGDAPPPGEEMSALRSPDGWAWVNYTVERAKGWHPYMAVIAADGRIVIAAAKDDHSTFRLWRSDDEGFPGRVGGVLPGYLQTMAAGPDGVLVGGGREESHGPGMAYVWRLGDDGRFEELAAVKDWNVGALAADASGYWLTTWRDDRRGLPVSSVWRSDGGGDPVRRARVQGEIWTIRPIASGLLATGIDLTPSYEGRVWTSPDGDEWTPAVLPAPSEGVTVIEVPGGYAGFAIQPGTRQGAERPILVWVSADGAAWRSTSLDIGSGTAVSPVLLPDGTVFTIVKARDSQTLTRIPPGNLVP